MLRWLIGGGREPQGLAEVMRGGPGAGPGRGLRRAPEAAAQGHLASAKKLGLNYKPAGVTATLDLFEPISLLSRDSNLLKERKFN
jgi:hypothetical protein